jgi:hypothetical protein
MIEQRLEAIGIQYLARSKYSVLSDFFNKPGLYHRSMEFRRQFFIHIHMLLAVLASLGLLIRPIQSDEHKCAQ